MHMRENKEKEFFPHWRGTFCLLQTPNKFQFGFPLLLLFVYALLLFVPCQLMSIENEDEEKFQVMTIFRKSSGRCSKYRRQYGAWQGIQCVRYVFIIIFFNFDKKSKAVTGNFKTINNSRYRQTSCREVQTNSLDYL